MFSIVMLSMIDRNISNSSLTWYGEVIVDLLWVPWPLSVTPGQPSCKLLALPQEVLPHKAEVSE